ncbi:MAG: PorV/PorQ family protein [bacterium]
MKRRKRSFVFIFTLFITLHTLHFTNLLATPGDGGGITLEEPADVRAVGLGEAYTALSDGASGSLWNPAGLSYQNLFMLETGMMSGYDAAGLITMGFAKPLKSGGAFALNVLQYSAGDMELITLDPSSGQVLNTKTVSAQEDTLIHAAYGRRVWKLDVGFGIKSLQSTLAGEYSAAAVCADFGIMLRSKDQKRSIGLAARNIGGSLTYISEADAIPMTIGFGIFWRWLGQENLKIQTLLDLKQNENETHVNLGNEFLWRKIVLRLGYQTGYEIKSLSMGAGIKLGKLNLDSSYTPTDAFDDVMRFSLSYNLAFKPKEEKYVAPEEARKIKAKKGERINIAVSDFVPQPPISSAESSFVSEFFRGDLTKYKVFAVIDRSNMDKILAEQGFQQTGCTTAECAIQMGKLLNVQKIVNGKVGKLVNRYIITISIIDVESGEIEYSDKDSCYKPEDLEDTVSKLVKRLADATR